MTEIPPTQDQPPPRRPFQRSTSDRMLAGVAGGLGKRFDIDPLAVRITFVILTFAGGIGVLAYLVGLVFMPSDDPAAPPMRWGLARTVGAGLLAVAALAVLVPDWVWGPAVPVLVIAGLIVYLLIRVVREEGTSHFGRMAAKAGIGMVLLALAAGGFAGAAAGAALGGGIAIAGLVIACGIGLVGGAFRGGARWLIAPALVLALPLGAVAATDLDVRGTWGDRTFRPATLAEVEQGFEMGAGSMRVDLRDVTLAPGTTELPVDIGMGEILVLVPEGTCVTVSADVGVGAVDSYEGEQGGVDFQVEEDVPVAAGVRHLHVAADIGVGALRVSDSLDDWVRGWDDRDHDWNGPDRRGSGLDRADCRAAA